MQRKILTLIIVILSIILLINDNTVLVFKEKIKINLNDNGKAIVFIITKDSTSLLIKNNRINILLILKSNDTVLLKENLLKFEIEKLDYLVSRKEVVTDIDYKHHYLLNDKLKIDDFEIEIDNLIKIYFDDYVFAIYDKEIFKNYYIDVDFLYILNNENALSLNILNEMEALFYNEGVRFTNKFLEYIYTKWVELYQVTKYDYVIIKFTDDNYDIITIPITEY